jgi:MoxR-like ATPase
MVKSDTALTCTICNAEIAIIAIQQKDEKETNYLCANDAKELLPALDLDTLIRIEAIVSPKGDEILKEFKIKQKIPPKSAIQVPSIDEDFKKMISKKMIEVKKPIVKESMFVKDLLPNLLTDTSIINKYSEDQLIIGLNSIIKKIPNVIDAIKPTETEILLRIDLNLPFVKSAYETYIYEGLKFPRGSKKFIIQTNLFLTNYLKWLKPTGLSSGSGTTVIQTTPSSIPIDLGTDDFKSLAEETINCKKFPSTRGIYKHFEEAKKYMVESGVWIQDKLLRKMLLAVERDTPFILYGEPGDGKSVITKSFMRWVCFYFNGGEDIYEGKKGKSLVKNTTNPIPLAVTTSGTSMTIQPAVPFIINENIKDDSNLYGIDYLSKNIDESTNSSTLYGGFSPEILSSAVKKPRRDNIEKGIFSRAMEEGKYIMLDELNRTDNETLGRLMGFLADPYNYDVPEGKLRYWYKMSSSERSNMVIIGTMNIGDVGNFKMSFAFKRRFKIIKVEYTEEEIGMIMEYLYGYIAKPTNKLDPEITTALKNIVNPLFVNGAITMQVLEKLEDEIKTFGKLLFSITHGWSKEANLVQFGVGVAHCKTVLEDISLFMIDIVRRNPRMLCNGITESTFTDKIKEIVTDAVAENVIMAIIDENDKYKMGKMEEKVKTLSTALTQVILRMINNISTNMNNLVASTELNKDINMRAWEGIWKFSKSKSEIKDLLLKPAQPISP